MFKFRPIIVERLELTHDFINSFIFSFPVILKVAYINCKIVIQSVKTFSILEFLRLFLARSTNLIAYPTKVFFFKMQI